LFRLGTAGLIEEKVTFPGSGPDATPGLPVMAVDDTAGTEDVDPALDGVLAVFNASPEAITEEVDGFAGRELALSPVQVDGADDVVRETSWDAQTGTVTVPARTVAVLVEAQDEVEPTPTPTDPTPTPSPTDPSPMPGDGGGPGGGTGGPGDDDGRPGAGPGGKLPQTGASLAVPVVVALLLLLAGATLANRRHRLG